MAPNNLSQVSFFAISQPPLKSSKERREGSVSQSSSRMDWGMLCPPREKEKACRISRWDVWVVMVGKARPDECAEESVRKREETTCVDFTAKSVEVE